MEASALKAQGEDVSPLLVEWQCGDTVRARLHPHRVVYGRIVQYTNGQICSFRDRDKENIYYYVKTTTKRKVWAPSSGLSVWVESDETTGLSLRDLDSRHEEESLLVNNSDDGKALVKSAASDTSSDGTPRKKKKKKSDHLVPLPVAQRVPGDKPDLNVEYELRTTPRTDKPTNQYKDFLRRGRDLLDENLHEKSLSNKDLSPDNHIQMSAAVEMDHYLSNVWQYIHNSKVGFANTTYESEASVDSEEEDASDPRNPGAVHVSWCVVCGKLEGELLTCGRCPVSYHESCRGGWTDAIGHRKYLTSERQEQVRMARLRKMMPVVGCSKGRLKLPQGCPVCVLGPGVTYGDIVWHKLGPWPWWPARVLPPGDLPSCLISTRKEQELTSWPLEFYDNPRQYAWARERRMCLLIPTHYECVASAEPELLEAFMEASDDYISAYLT